MDCYAMNFENLTTKIDDDEIIGLIPNIHDEFIHHLMEKEQNAILYLYFSTAISENITLKDCILKYSVEKTDNTPEINVHDYNSMIASRISCECHIRLVRRAPIKFNSDALQTTLDSCCAEFISLLAKALKVY